MDRTRVMATDHRCVMLETVVAQMIHKRLKIRHLANSNAPCHVEGLIGEVALPDVAADLPVEVIRRHTKESHRAGLDMALDRAEAAIPPKGFSQNVELRDFDVAANKSFRKIPAVRTDTLIPIFAIVVVPIEKR